MTHHRRKRFIPCVEVLESRLAPSTLPEVVSPPPEAIVSNAAGPTPSAWASAPYIDVTANNALQLMQQAMQQGTRYFNLAFVQSDPSGNAVWGSPNTGSYPATSGTFASQLLGAIQQDRALGGDVAVSFGGYNASVLGQELAQVITNPTTLQAQYQSVITYYSLDRIDFDIEANAVTDQASVARRNQTIAALEGANPGLQVVYTLHADPSVNSPGKTAAGGLPAGQLALLQNAVAQGVSVTEVNVMTMDWGSWWVDGRTLGTAAIAAAQAANLQLQGLFNISESQAWAMEGITMHIGQNAADTGTFALADANQVLQFIQTVHPGTISFWSINKDALQYNWQFSSVFNQYPAAVPYGPITPIASIAPSQETISPPEDPLGPAENPAPASAWAFAPYIDVAANNGIQLIQQAMAQGIRYFNLAFVQAGQAGPYWGKAAPAASGTFASNLLSAIKQDRALGGDVAVSFGGATACEAKQELAQVITNPTTLQAQYQSVITFYSLKRIDFDIENGAFDAASVDRRNQVIAKLEAANPGLQVTYTLHANPPVPSAQEPGGMPADRVALLKDAIKDGATVTEVNLMTMDYGSWWVSGRPLGQVATLAAKAANLQLQGLFNKTEAQVWAMEGITVHLGPQAGGTFTPQDGRVVINFFKPLNPATLSFWSVNDDANTFKWTFTNIFLGKTPLGTSANDLYVESVYENLLNRPADAGAAYWVNLLDQDVTPTTIVADIEKSAEYLNNVVTALYQQYLNRTPDSGGLTNWVNDLENGATIEQVIDGIVSSPEFFQNAGGTNAGYVTALYEDILNRAPDSGGYTAWFGGLNNGASPAAVATAFLNSAEYQSDLVQQYYSLYLDRSADSGGLASWLAALQSGWTDQAVLAGILGSAEAYAKLS